MSWTKTGTGIETIGDGVPTGAGANGPLPVTTYDIAGNATRLPTVFKPQSTVAVGTETTVWTPAAGKKFRLMRMFVSASSSATLTFRDGTGGTIIAVAAMTAGTGNPVDFGNGILSAAANNVLTCTASAAANLIGTIMGTEE